MAKGKKENPEPLDSKARGRERDQRSNDSNTYYTKKRDVCQVQEGSYDSELDVPGALFEDAFYGKLKHDNIEDRLSPEHLEDLRQSGLRNDTILAAQLVTVSSEASEDYLSYAPHTPCMVFPYPRLRGDAFYRLKPQRPLVYGNGDVRKYLAKKNGGNRLYLPPYEDQRGVITDTECDLIITEGEKKALKAYQEGFTAIAFSGVWNWKERTDSGTGQSRVIPELDGFCWSNRTVYVAFDSDAAENRDVEKAQQALAKHLHGRGARVIIVRLPSLDGQKTGLDDYLIKKSAKDLSRLLQGSMPPSFCYFQDGSFKPVRLAGELSRRDNYIFAKDMESKGGQLYVYTKGVYRSAGSVEQKAQHLLGEEAVPKRLSDTRAVLSNMVIEDVDNLNPSDSLINVKNGLLDPYTGKLKQHNPEFLSTIQIPTRWNPEARSEELDEFLDTICGRWQDSICELIGYLLIPKNFIKSFFVFPGDTDTGKTTLLNIITGMLGDRLCAEESLQTLCDPSRRFVHAHLENKLLNVFDDMPAGYIGDSSAIKVLTGGTPHIRIERKYEDAYHAPNFCRHIYACNELPRCADKTEAWYNRMEIFPFEHRLSKAEKKEGLRERFSTDKSLHEALLAKAVRGLRNLRDKKWKLSGSPEAMADYKAKNDSVLAFISDCCVQGDDLEIRRTDFKREYDRWCDHSGAYKLPTAKELYDRVRREHQFGEKTVKGYDYFTGFDLKDDVILD